MSLGRRWTFPGKRLDTVLGLEGTTRIEKHEVDDVTRDSGGQRLEMLNPNGLDGALEQLASELTSQYRVVYARPDSLIRPERAEVSSRRDGVTMHGARARGETGD